MKIFKTISFFAFLAIFFSLTSCGGGSSRGSAADLDRKIKTMLRDDNAITAAEWSELSELANGTELSGQALFDYVLEVAESRRDNPGSPTIAADLPNDGGSDEVADLTFSLYMESSASMYPYTTSSTNFKTALYDLLTRISDKGEHKDLINYIGQVIFPVAESTRDFIAKRDPFDVAKQNKAKINTASTDINEIIKLIFEKGNKNAINILVSDCIYSIQGSDSRDGLSKMQYITKDIFKKYADDYSVLVLQLTSEYDGKYYPYSGGSVNYEGTRPYYMLFIGKNALINKMLNNKAFQEIQDFESLAGFENYHLFNGEKGSEVYYSVLPTTEKEGSFRTDSDYSDRNYVHGLKDMEVSKRDDDDGVQFAVAVDLSGVLVEESYKTSPKNYNIEGSDDFQIDEIEALDEYSKADKRYIGSATHLVTIQTDKINEKSQQLKIGLKKVLPSWISDASTEDDSKMGSDKKLKDKTFGLEYMMNGIDGGYNKTGSAPMYFEISVNLKK